MNKLLLSLCLLLSQLPSRATVWNVPGTYPYIMQALYACSAGDTVLVQPGYYAENIVWPQVNSIKLLGSGPLGTTISALGSGRVVYVSGAGIDTTTEFSGFTVTDGAISGGGSGFGAGIYVSNCSITMRNLVVTGNRVYAPGGYAYGSGVHLSTSSSVLDNCLITANSIDSGQWVYGGGIYMDGGSPILRDVHITNNLSNSSSESFGGGLYASNSTFLILDRVLVEGNVFGSNGNWYYGAGMYLNNVTNVNMTNVLVAANMSGSGGSFNKGGGIYFEGTTNAMLMNVTVAENSSAGSGTIDGSGIFVSDAVVTAVNCIFYNPNSGSETGVSGSATLNILWSDVRGGFTGINNIDILPGFVSATDFQLIPTSPCAGVGTDNGAPFIDLVGNPRPQPAFTFTDMGCYEVNQPSNGIGEHAATNGPREYPNPAHAGSDVFVNGVFPFTIADCSGRVVRETSWISLIPGSTTARLAPGFYVIGFGDGKTVKFLLTGN